MADITDELRDLGQSPITSEVPDWDATRSRLLTSITEAPRTRSRWGSWAVAAAIVLVLAVPLAWWTLTQRPFSATPATGATAPPTQTLAQPTGPSVLVRGVGFLQQKPGDVTRLCLGGVTLAQPMECHAFVPTENVDWAQVGFATTTAGTKEAPALVEGRWDGRTLFVSSIDVPPTTPVATHAPASDPKPLCDNPGGGSTSSDDGPAGASLLPGYQGEWITTAADGATVWNVAVTHDAAAAERTLREHFTGPLCVGTVPGPSLTEAEAAVQRIKGLYADLDVHITNVLAHPGPEGVRITVDVFLAPDDVIAKIKQAAGADLEARLTITPQFAIVG